MLKNLLFIIVIGIISGCSTISEPVKTLWGSSTRALDKARVNGISQRFSCRFDDCFDSVLKLARAKSLSQIGFAEEVTTTEAEPLSLSLDSDKKKPVVDDGVFDIFLKDRVRGLIVVMGIRGNVNTTEVGIFFTRPEENLIQVEISSLSTTAKEKVAKAVFEALNRQFKTTN